MATYLSGCGIPIGVLYGLQAVGAVATIADKVIGIDVALSQDTSGKTPILSVVPVVP